MPTKHSIPMDTSGSIAHTIYKINIMLNCFSFTNNIIANNLTKDTHNLPYDCVKMATTWNFQNTLDNSLKGHTRSALLKLGEKSNHLEEMEGSLAKLRYVSNNPCLCTFFRRQRSQ